MTEFTFTAGVDGFEFKQFNPRGTVAVGYDAKDGTRHFEATGTADTTSELLDLGQNLAQTTDANQAATHVLDYLVRGGEQ